MHPNGNTPRFNFNGIAANNSPFRGKAHEIGRVDTVDEALVKAGLDWNVARRPYLIQGKDTTRPSRFKALVRSDNGHEIAPCSDSYTPIQNRDLMGAFFQAAGDAGVRVTHAGMLYEGARVFATAEMPASFELPVGQAWLDRIRRDPDHGWRTADKTVLQIVMSTGHEPGQKARFMAQAYRLICSNGARLTEMLGSVAIAHRGSRQATRLGLWEVGESINKAVEQFRAYQHKAEILHDAKSSGELDRAYVVELLAPEAWRAIVAETEAQVHQAHPGRLTGTDLLNAIIERTYTARFESALETRSVAAVLDAIQTQTGAEMAAGTLWGTYNGVTYHVDHRAGRNIDAAVESSLYGQGDKLKVRAMDLAMVYAEAAGARVV
jgi:hypothetical protein